MTTFGEDLVRLIEAHGISHAFGCFGGRPESADEFTQAVTEALSAPKPTLIEIVEDAAWLQ